MTNRPTNTLPITGHALLAEGSPHDEMGQRIQTGSTAGWGRAKCQCGEMSSPLTSRNARARWHRDHKMLIRGEARA